MANQPTADDYSDISVSSYISKKDNKNSSNNNNNNHNLQKEQQQHLKSTGFPSIPAIERPITNNRKRAILSGEDSKNAQEYQSSNLLVLVSSGPENAKTASKTKELETLSLQLQQLEHNQAVMEQKFTKSLRILQEEIMKRDERNQYMKLEIEGLRQDLNERRKDITVLISMLKANASTLSQQSSNNNQYEYNSYSARNLLGSDEQEAFVGNAQRQTGDNKGKKTGSNPKDRKVEGGGLGLLAKKNSLFTKEKSPGVNANRIFGVKH